MIRFLAGMAVLAAIPVRAAVWSVSNAVQLKAALVVAETNLQSDTVYLAAGWYEVDDLAGQLLTYEPVSGLATPEDYSLTLCATGGAVVIDGNASKQVMRIDIFGNDFPNADVTVKGITFREGRISSTIWTGAGLYIRTRHADILVENCTFYANIARHIFQDPNCGGCYVRADGTGNAVVRNCRFLDNYADIFGGGLYCVGNGTLVVENCVFLRNEAWRGGGFYLSGQSSNMIRNNTFIDNLARDAGGGMYIYIFQDFNGAVLQNNIVWGNQVVTNSGADIFLEDDPLSFTNGIGADITIQYCDFSDLDFVDGDNTKTNNNFDLDPLVVDTNASDCRLTLNSPCIDSGTNLVAVTNDIRRAPRPLDGDAVGGAAHDLGAYEYGHPVLDTDGDGMTDNYEVNGGIDPTDATGDDGAGGDPDMDGVTNFLEFVADTVPTDSDSLLRMTAIANETNDVRVTWQGGVLVTQYLERCTNLLGGAPDWVAVFTNHPPTATIVEYLDTNTVHDRLYYRIKAAR